MRVTIVDDSAGDRKLCRILLEEKYGRDLEFVEAPTAAAGIAACSSEVEGPDCLLLDYKLPDMSGLEFLAKLSEKTGQRVRKFAVVMLTGLGNEGVAAAAIKAGVQDYLVKDRITAESLQLAVENALEKVSMVQALKADRDRLERSVAEKDLLLSEVHHRVKNNLQVIASLLRLQSEELETQGPEADGERSDRAIRALRDSQTRVESMAMIHEQLYATPSSEGTGLKEVDLAAFTSVLAANLMYAYGVDPKRIECQVNVEPLFEPIDRAIPAGLILNELLSNALRHAFPDNRSGRLWIAGRGGNGEVELEVGDNGIGMKEGAETARTKSLGFEIVRILTRQMRGVFAVERNGGTICRVRFPKTYMPGSVSGGAPAAAGNGRREG